MAVLLLLMLTISGVAAMSVNAYPALGASNAPPNSLLYDDFTHDASLNASLWVINGPVGSALVPNHDAGVNPVQLAPNFTSAGMTIAQVNARQEYGTIESIASFTPPFTVTAVVEGMVSDGHTFGFAISTQNASSGVLIYGNLNPTDCSNLGDCGDPNVCGNTANPNVIPANQCYYGLQAKSGEGSNWSKLPKLDLTPSVNVTYTLQFSVNAPGTAQYAASQGGQVLGVGTVQIGTGPFYVIMYQSEGSPVQPGKLNRALWMSVSLAPGAATLSTTSSVSTSSSQPGPSPSPSGVPIVWIIIALVSIALFLLIILWYRRRGFTVEVLDSRTQSPIRGASVTAKGPENLSATADKDGKAKFGSVDEGEYAVGVTAQGYVTPTPVTVKVKKKTEYTARLSRNGPGTQGGGGENAPAGPQSPEAGVVAPSSSLEKQQPQPGFAGPAQESAPSAITQPGPGLPLEQQALEVEGFGGPRMRQIIRTFQEKGAISPETALTADELGLSRLFVRIMKRRQGKTRVFMEVNGRYYLNQKALGEMQ